MFLASVEFDSDDTRLAIVESCQRFHEDTRVLSEDYNAKLKRQNYVTPTRSALNTFAWLIDVQTTPCFYHVWNTVRGRIVGGRAAL